MEHTIPLDKTVFSQFLLAGVAEFTIVSHGTGKRYSFEIVKCSQEASTIPIPPVWVRMYVSKVRGPGRVALYMGAIFNNNNILEFKHSRNRKRYEDCEGMKAFKWVFKHRDNIPDTVEILYSGRCSVCNRKITTPKSIKRGIGPVCLKNLAKVGN